MCTQRYACLDKAAQALSCRYREQEPMSLHTTFKIGGPADRLLFVETERQLKGLLAVLEGEGLPWLPLGNGSNLLVSDKGIRGAVLYLGGELRRVRLLPDGVTVEAGAAASLATVCVFARDHGLGGLEFAWGIPGTVGGAVYMNAGAYGGEIKDVAVSAFHVDQQGQPCQVMGEELAFGYRKSFYTGSRHVITRAQLRLERAPYDHIAARMEELMGRRREKQPYDMPSAGSVFKRPASGYAAAMIDQCGLKGRRVGGAQVSEKHAGFIVNTGGATCADVLELVHIIQDVVQEKTGTRLECEIRAIGEGM